MSMKINFNEGKKSRETIQLIILQILSDRGYTNDITFHGAHANISAIKIRGILKTLILLPQKMLILML